MAGFLIRIRAVCVGSPSAVAVRPSSGQSCRSADAHIGFLWVRCSTDYGQKETYSASMNSGPKYGAELITTSSIHLAYMLFKRRSGIFLRHSLIVAPILSLNGPLGMFLRCRLLRNSDLLFFTHPRFSILIRPSISSIPRLLGYGRVVLGSIFKLV